MAKAKAQSSQPQQSEQPSQDGATASSQGKIVQCIGAVVDVEFPRDKMPNVYDALKLEGTELTLEVQQQVEAELDDAGLGAPTQASSRVAG